MHPVVGDEDSRTKRREPAGARCDHGIGCPAHQTRIPRSQGTERGRAITLLRSVRAADAPTGRRLIAESLSRVAVRLVSDTEIEAIRGRIVAAPSVPERPRLKRDDLLAALAVFLLVVASTFPVVLPFVVFADVGTAKAVSRAIALTMLFFGGLALGRYAGYGSWKVGLMMAGLGTALIAAVMALGG